MSAWEEGLMAAARIHGCVNPYSTKNNEANHVAWQKGFEYGLQLNHQQAQEKPRVTLVAKVYYYQNMVGALSTVVPCEIDIGKTYVYTVPTNVEVKPGYIVSCGIYGGHALVVNVMQATKNMPANNQNSDFSVVSKYSEHSKHIATARLCGAIADFGRNSKNLNHKTEIDEILETIRNVNS